MDREGGGGGGKERVRECKRNTMYTVSSPAPLD